MNSTYNLDRFLTAQTSMYDIALKELENGKKQSHWMWYIFPQLKELGFSSTAKFYGIDGIDEAQAYLQHPVLRNRLEACVKTVIASKAKKAIEIFGHTDYLKFHSSLTLFLLAEPENPLFKDAIERYYQGILNFDTENILTNRR